MIRTTNDIPMSSPHKRRVTAKIAKMIRLVYFSGDCRIVRDLERLYLSMDIAEYRDFHEHVPLFPDRLFVLSAHTRW
jgi:hypothetical protein